MRIAVHAFDGISLFHLSVPTTVFTEVARLGLDPSWHVTVWSSTAQVTTAEGVTIGDLRGPEVAAEADLLVFPSWHGDLRAADDVVTNEIDAAEARGARLAGLCLGAFPLADTGVLNGRATVTHWGAADHLATRHPDLEVDANAIYLDHGDVLTSAGTASAIDACLHIVRRELGAEAAATLARHLVVAPHRDGGQAQYIDRPMPEKDGVGQLGKTFEWVLAHLDEEITVEVMADRARMSRRNFSRRFSEVTGVSPAKWVLGRRLDESRRLLERSSLPVEAVARHCGFGSVVTFRQSFNQAYGTTPTSYRRRFAVTSDD
ncbi:MULTISPECIES: helix-turn-helix domain-containing protein [unclassified Aeromicrobium]|uniref:GlxA family transcriptional regulator n=1 Tax=unclassified Aeromicrobium TaxID=2633570 RepID=UPI002889B562|nr:MULTISPECIES: helix-turn-helix domain-containing protein [unclassified Aeromicrobium]